MAEPSQMSTANPLPYAVQGFPPKFGALLNPGDTVAGAGAEIYSGRSVPCKSVLSDSTVLFPIDLGQNNDRVYKWSRMPGMFPETVLQTVCSAWILRTGRGSCFDGEWDIPSPLCAVLTP